MNNFDNMKNILPALLLASQVSLEKYGQKNR